MRGPRTLFALPADEARAAAAAVGAPPELAELAVRCCEWDPEDRPLGGSAAGELEALAHALGAAT